MDLTVNGVHQTYDLSELTVEKLLELLQLPPTGLVVEINGYIYKEPDFLTVGLKPKDQVELIHFMGGGSGY